MNVNVITGKYTNNDYFVSTTETNAEKIYYFQSDHSAITATGFPGMYISKWGAMPLMRHAPSYGPYLNMDKRSYYRSTVVEGSSNSTGNVYDPLQKGENRTFYANNPISGNNFTKTWWVGTSKDDTNLIGTSASLQTSGNNATITFNSTGLLFVRCYYYSSSGVLLAVYSSDEIVVES